MTNLDHAPRRLESYVLGHWVAGQRDGQPLRDAATGRVVATIDSTGVDFAASLAYGRDVAGPLLRRLTFHERAAMLKALGLKLMEMKEEFYIESFPTGATRADSAIDIDGGIGTMLTFASKAQRELPNTNVLTDGQIENLSKDGSFVAQHIMSPLQGVALHINAFNFPVWGMLEKIAPALIAGVPCLVKPASQTAYLTERVVRRIVELDILPKGALQLICGSVGDMLDHITGQDAVSFTGSAAVGRMLRSHPAVIENAARFTMEADSLNVSILGPDAGVGTPEFDLFTKEVAREMTTKAGQKCTAIRRVIVPRAQVSALIAALSERLQNMPVGLPDDGTVRMGPLASLEQRSDVLARLKDLQADAEIVAGNPDQARLVSGDAAIGAFMNPVLMYCDRPFAGSAVHDVEAFGPVATIMPYDDLDEALALAAKGKGSLVSSVFTDDPAVARSAVLGLAPHHGRVLIGNRETAKSSTGHGSPLAALVHGGPGRAGGGEEMGGMRGVMHYMQRTAVQGSPRLLSQVTGRWIEGAAVQSGVHPFRKSLEDLRIGDQLITAARQVTQQDVEHFAHFTGDTFYAHMDSAAAKANPFFDDRVAHGYLIASFAAGLFVDAAPGPVLANYGVDNLRFLTPVYFGDTMQVRLTCKEINARIHAEHGEVRWDCHVTNQTGQLVAKYDVLTMVAKVWPSLATQAG